MPMRLIALACAVLLFGAGVVWAQSAYNPFDPTGTLSQQTTSNQPGVAGGATGAGTATGGPTGFGTGSTTGGAGSGLPTGSTAGAAAGLQSSANPLAGATAGIVAVSQATPATQNGFKPIFIAMADGTQASVYGTELFTGAFAGTRPSDRPDYVIQPGDQVVVNLYGAVNNGGSETVDSTGNIFIVGVGPVHVSGVQAGALQGVVSAAVGRVFTSAVSVYTAVGSSGTIGVYVTGDIQRPGRYDGGPHDSVMFFLSQAGGVDATQGSFRNIAVRRNGQVVATYDLYDFLQDGRVQPIRFEDGDVIFVGSRGPMISATGAGRNDRAFEAPADGKPMTGADLINLVHLEPGVVGALVHGVRNGEPKAAYFPIDEFARVVLSDGDHVDFSIGGILKTVSVSIQGKVNGPTVYVMPDGATLGQLLAKIPLQGTDVETRWVHVQRPSVAQEQKKALQQALFNLQKQVLTASPPTSSSAALAASQASLITQFVTQAQTITPDGNIAVYTNGQFQDLRLEEGDVVVLPNRTDVVMVSGEVISPGGLAHVTGMDLVSYIDRAGGFAAHANKHRFVLRHPDGSAGIAGPKDRPQPGDDIVVMPNVGNDSLQVFIDLTQLLFQLALSSATVISVAHNL